MSRNLKVLHVAYMTKPSKGVVKQMVWEQEAASRLGIAWDCRLYTNDFPESEVVKSLNVRKSASAIFNYFNTRKAYFNKVEKLAEEYDLILLRHMMHSVDQAAFLRKYGEKVYTVHHTKELSELRVLLSFPLNYFVCFLELMLGAYSINKSKGVIAVTEEILRYELQRIRSDLNGKSALIYPNGIAMENIELEDRREDIPEIIFVASSFVPWHGLDRLIDSFDGNSSDFVLHIAGNVPERLQRRCCLDARIKLHGVLEYAELVSLYEKSWCGISSLALDRKSMSEACTLKTREYLSVGIPVYSDHIDSALPCGFEFHVVGEASIGKILEFSKEHRRASRQLVRESASHYISKVKIFEQLYSRLSTNL